MAPISPFTAGPRLGDSPRGDPAAQAVASLRGYAYQLYVSGLAWLDLKAGQELYLEVAKDYAVAAGDALRAVEVKDTAASNVTINSDDVRETLDSFVDLVERNPERKIHLRFLSTSQIGRERQTGDRASGQATLDYWRRAASGADVAPLRKVLDRAKLTPRVRAFIDARSDPALREELLRPIHWDCGHHGLDGVIAELEAGLLRYSAERLNALPADKHRLSAAVLQHVLITIVQPGPRRLTDLDLLAVLNSATQVSLTSSEFHALLRAATGLAADYEGPTLQAARLPRLLEPERDIPLPPILAERRALIVDILEMAKRHGAAFVTGSTGSGKTILARLTARLQGGPWDLLDLRNASAEEAAQRLDLALGSLGLSDPAGIILDDLNEIEDPGVCRALSRFLLALRRRDAFCLVTAYREPSARTFSELGIDRASHLAVPDLTVEEVGAIVTAAGGDAATWAKTVHMAAAFGHPQLAQAVITGLRARSWPREELGRLKVFERSPDVEAERSAARRRLVAAVPDEARTLLYRLSLLIGRFERPLALALGALAPEVNQPGVQLDSLIGPWIEQVVRDQLRMSPLLQNAGREVLAPADNQMVHRAAAEHIVAGRSIDVDKADVAFLHALLGKSEPVLMKLAYGIIRADAATRRRLSDWITGIRLHRLDRPIYPEKPMLSLTLRFAQFLLAAGKGDGAAIRKCWQVLQAELKQEPDSRARESMEYLVLAKVLIDQAAAGLLPNWVDLIWRFEELSNADPQRKEILEQMKKPIDGRPAPDPLGMLFIVQMMGIPNTSGLKAAFDQIDALKPKQRGALFAEATKMPSDFALLVNHAGLAEQKRGNADARAGAELYGQMAIQAQGWGYRELALRCHVARAIMFDEYADDAVDAEKALDDAVKIFGEDPVLSRARARILYHRKEHARALPLLRDAADKTALKDPVERAYMLREAAICAAETGGWSEAQRWFGEAREAASRAQSPAMKAMTVGLRADEALAAFKAGNAIDALVGLQHALDELPALDPESSLAAAYCHRVVRHAGLWLFGQGAHENISVHGQEAVMLPGMCSNPEPTDLRDMPLGSLDYAHYLLALTEIELDVNAGIEAGLKSRLGGRAIPSMDIMLRHAGIERDMRGLNTESFLSHLPTWLDSQIYMEGHRDMVRNHGPLNPAYGEIAVASSGQLQSQYAVFASEDALLTFGIMAALARRPAVLASFCARIADNKLAEIMTGRGEVGERLDDYIAAEVHKVAARDDLTPDELLRAGIRFAQSAKRSNFQRFLTPVLAAWARERWTHAIEQQQFYLRNPSITVQPIKEILASPATGLSFVGKLLVAAVPAVKTRLDESFREFLLSL